MDHAQTLLVQADAVVGSRKKRDPATSRLAVVIPMPGDPDWTLFDAIPEHVPIIVVDDTDGGLDPAPRKNVRYFDYAAQRDVMGNNYKVIPHKSAACRNFGHYLAYQEGFEVIVALDYDCRTRAGWIETHVSALGMRDLETLKPAGEWLNTLGHEDTYARGFPYDLRDGHPPSPGRTTSNVSVNMGLWDHVLDINGIDKLRASVPSSPAVKGTYGALGTVPLCGMNTSFAASLTPAYFFLPDFSVNGWHVSRHDDIWGGYVLQKLMQKRGDLVSFGDPVVEHTRQSDLDRVIALEHYQHLMASDFYATVDRAVDQVSSTGYAQSYAEFAEAFEREVESSRMPEAYRVSFRFLGSQMKGWSRCFI